MTSATWPPDVRDLGRRATKDPYLVVVGTLNLTVSLISPSLITRIESFSPAGLCKREAIHYRVPRGGEERAIL